MRCVSGFFALGAVAVDTAVAELTEQHVVELVRLSGANAVPGGSELRGLGASGALGATEASLQLRLATAVAETESLRAEVQELRACSESRARELGVSVRARGLAEAKVASLEVKLAERPWQEDSSSILHTCTIVILPHRI